MSADLDRLDLMLLTLDELELRAGSLGLISYDLEKGLKILRYRAEARIREREEAQTQTYLTFNRIVIQEALNDS